MCLKDNKPQDLESPKINHTIDFRGSSGVSKGKRWAEGENTDVCPLLSQVSFSCLIWCLMIFLQIYLLFSRMENLKLRPRPPNTWPAQRKDKSSFNLKSNTHQLMVKTNYRLWNCRMFSKISDTAAWNKWNTFFYTFGHILYFIFSFCSQVCHVVLHEHTIFDQTKPTLS